MNPVVLPWLSEIILISWRSLSGTHFTIQGVAQPGNIKGKVVKTGGTKRLPLPSELLATFLAFGVYSLISEKDARIAQLLGWGTVLATGILLLGGGSTAQSQEPQQPQETPFGFTAKPQPSAGQTQIGRPS